LLVFARECPIQHTTNIHLRVLQSSHLLSKSIHQFNELGVGMFTGIQAVIFDCDGVLVDSEAMSCYALNVVFQNEFGIDIGTNYSNIIGTSLKFSLQYYLNKFQLSTTNIQHLADLKETAYYEMAKKRLTSFPNCEEFIRLLLQNDYPVTVASSGSLNKIRFSLDAVNLSKYFSIVTSALEVKHGKPAPDLFFLAANKLSVKPSSCLVIEDSINGVRAATNAGMQVAGFPGTFQKDLLINEGAIYVKNGYSDLIEQLNEYLRART
jgi:HAD superfamily hydrolase (TIGR01509 family)